MFKNCERKACQSFFVPPRTIHFLNLFYLVGSILFQRVPVSLDHPDQAPVRIQDRLRHAGPRRQREDRQGRVQGAGIISGFITCCSLDLLSSEKNHANNGNER